MCNISLRFIVHIILHGYGLQYNTRSKRVNEEILRSRRKTSFFAIFQVNCSHCLPVLHGCGLHYSVLSGLSEVKGLTSNYITVHYPGRKLVFIGATFGEFRFFMRLRT